MDCITLPANYVMNFKRNCKSKTVSDSSILSLLGNIEMVNNKADNLIEIIKEYRPHIYNYIK